MGARGAFIFRADGNAGLGHGHLVRCLTLAAELERQGGRILFVTREFGGALWDRIDRRSYELIIVPSAATLAEDARLLGATIHRLQREGELPLVILDGYDFDADYQRAILKSGAFLALIDDLAATSQVAHLILNQNIWARPGSYPDVSPSTHLLLGTEYALLREEFLETKREQTRSQPLVADRVLVTFGGGDEENVTGRVARWLAESDISARFVLLVGPDYPHLPVLRKWVEPRSARFTIAHAPRNVAALMAETDVAISGAGSTCWELCFMGVPSLVIILADNQARIADGLGAAGIADNLGWFTTLTPERLKGRLKTLLADPRRREAMSKAGRAIIDGRGAQRVASAMVEMMQAGSHQISSG